MNLFKIEWQNNWKLKMKIKLAIKCTTSLYTLPVELITSLQIIWSCDCATSQNYECMCIYILFWYCVYSTQSHYYWPKKRELNEVHDYNSLLSIRSIISTKRIVSINGNNIRTMTIPNAVLHFIEYALLYSSGVKWSDRRVRSVVISLQYFYRKKKSAFFNRTKIAIKIREKWKLIIDWNLI